MGHIMYDADDDDHQAEEITGIDFPDGITAVYGDFNENEITELVFPDSVTRIEATFSYNPIEQIQLPPRLAFIGTEAFLENQLSEIDIPDSVTEIESGAFCNNQLTCVAIPSKLQFIAENLFADNQLDTVEFPGNGVLVQIEGGAFFNNQLESIEIPDSVKFIGDGAFGGNPLTSITIGAGVKALDNAPEFAENTFGDHGKSFIAAYNANGKKAGAYIYNEESDTWSIDGDDADRTVEKPAAAPAVPAAGKTEAPTANTVEALKEKGDKALEEKDFSGAITAYTAAIRAPGGSNDGELFCNRGIAYRNLEDWDRARRDFIQAQSISPTVSVYYNDGLVFSALFRKDASELNYKAARKQFTQALNLDPANVLVTGALYELDKQWLDMAGKKATEAFKAEDWHAAAKGFTAILEVPIDSLSYNYPPPEDMVLRGNAFLLRGYAHYKSRLYTRAISDLNEALRLSPHAKGYQYLGWTYDALGDYAKARENLLQALQLDPVNENVKSTLSEIDKKISAPKAETAAVPPAPTAAPSAAGISCAKCGAQIPAGAKFCPSCGTPAAPAPAFCSQCGAKLASGAQFCSSSGTKVSAPR